MTDEERDELIEKSLLHTLDPADENRVQQLLREDESFRREYEFQEKLIQQVRLKSRQDMKRMFAQFESDYQASANEKEQGTTPIIPLDTRNETDDTAPGPAVIPLWRQSWFRIAASILFVAGIIAIIWSQKNGSDLDSIADRPDSTRSYPPKNTEGRDSTTLPEQPAPRGPIAQKPADPIRLSGPVRLPYYETDDVSLGFGENQKTREYRTVVFLIGTEPAYEFQDTLKVYFPTLPLTQTRWSLIYSRNEDSYYLTSGATRYELIKGLQGRQPLQKSK
ncbi:anti-sigma factor family protein [Larkinella arboricola]